MLSMPRLRILMPLMALAMLWSLPSHAQVRRCTGPDGGAIFTDRRCGDIGATDRVPHASGGQAARFYRGGCARNLQDLIYELTAAIDSGDANRLAGVYHWVGMSSSAGYAVMGQLDAIARRPLVDVVPVFPGSTNGEGDDYYPQTTVRRMPIGLRLEQTLSNGSTPSRTVLGLRQYLGCWWVHL
ncbi:MAG TPA: hypothetical protein VHF02_07375 [Luteimonas sp.]|nr:hypothetical protein [Luteimonas sp.]